MRLFAISDLHLPGRDDKPMDVFGDKWKDHFARISADWRTRVAPDDAVLIPGDISWAMSFDDALDDLAAICALPGRKVLLKGNHDYWWNSVSRLRAALGEDAFALQNDSLLLGDTAVAGSRGWDAAEMGGKVYRRELIRTELSLASAAARHPRRIVAMLHYPPFDDKGAPTPFCDLFARYGVAKVVYGHIHNVRRPQRRVLDGIDYALVSCDSLGFRLLELDAEPNASGEP